MQPLKVQVHSIDVVHETEAYSRVLFEYFERTTFYKTSQRIRKTKQKGGEVDGARNCRNSKLRKDNLSGD